MANPFMSSLRITFSIVAILSTNPFLFAQKPTKITPSATTPSYTLDFKIGQMILIGLNDRKFLSEDDSLRQELTAGKAGGIILFEKNIAPNNSKEQLKTFISDLQNSSPYPLFISIDEEGGKVHRLKEKYGFVKMPSAAYLGGLGYTDSTSFYTKSLAKQLSYLGINLNFAPDVDLAINPDNPVITKAGRSYSANPIVVAEHATASIKAHHTEGIKTALKHFPGHGSSVNDSHYGVAEVTKFWKEEELIPYKNIISFGNPDAIMTAHIVNRILDTTGLPATLSKTIVTGLLRNTLGFNGVVISDDMQMYAISKNFGLENALKMSIEAGVDILLFGNNVSLTDRIKTSQIHALVKSLVEKGEITEERINESFARIMALKEKKVN